MNMTVLERAPVASQQTNLSGAGLSLRSVTKSFGAKTVLHGIDLDIPAGQFVAIVGRSGCGKSTLLRLISGLDQATSGAISIENNAEVRLMFQEPRLLPWQRVVANVEVGLPPGPDRRSAAEAVLAQVGLSGRGGEWPSVLSGGQKQRVALARALASHPALLAFDEPLGALDALTRIEMQNLVEQVWASKGFTAIVVTHDVTEAVALADRIILLDHGRIAMDVAVDLPRPRRRGSPEAAAIEGAVLDRLLASPE